MRWLLALFLSGCVPGDEGPTSVPWYSVAPAEPPEAGPGLPVALTINEWMAANEGSLVVDGEVPDWVELHNGAPIAQPLDGFTIADGLDATPHRFGPGVVVPPRGVLLLFADGTTQSPAHLPFRLARDGEALILRAPSGRVVDHVEWEALPADVAVARWPDGADALELVLHGTPGALNR